MAAPIISSGFGLGIQHPPPDDGIMESGPSNGRPWRPNPSKTGVPEEVTVSIPPPNPRNYYDETKKEKDRAFRPALPFLRRRSELLSRAAAAEWAVLNREEETKRWRRCGVLPRTRVYSKSAKAILPECPYEMRRQRHREPVIAAYFWRQNLYYLPLIK